MHTRSAAARPGRFCLAAALLLLVTGAPLALAEPVTSASELYDALMDESVSSIDVQSTIRITRGDWPGTVELARSVELASKFRCGGAGLDCFVW